MEQDIHPRVVPRLEVCASRLERLCAIHWQGASLVMALRVLRLESQGRQGRCYGPPRQIWHTAVPVEQLAQDKLAEFIHRAWGQMTLWLPKLRRRMAE